MLHEQRWRLDPRAVNLPRYNLGIRTFLIINLFASGHLARIDVQVPQGTVKWVEWEDEDKYPRSYDGEAAGRLVLRLSRPYGETEAQWIADVLGALIDLVYGPTGVSLATLEWELDEVRPRASAEEIYNSLDVFDPRAGAVRGWWWPTDDPIMWALAALPAVLGSTSSHDHGLPAALLYYKLSTADYAFLGDDMRWAMSDEGHEPPSSSYERAKVEQAFHNTFKAIEALVDGEPPANDRKFRDRLVNVGVDPDEMVGYRPTPKEPLFDVLKRIRETRDARAAHAGRTSAPKRGISYYELMEAQAGAAAALGRAVVHLAPIVERRVSPEDLASPASTPQP